jgi:hypothetical protein
MIIIRTVIIEWAIVIRCRIITVIIRAAPSPIVPSITPSKRKTIIIIPPWIIITSMSGVIITKKHSGSRGIHIVVIYYCCGAGIISI